MRMKVKVEGLSDLNRALEQLKKSTRGGVLNRVLKKAAKPVEDAAKKNAPVDTGALKESIGTTIIRRNAGKSAFAAAMRAGVSRQEAGAAARAANADAAGRGASATIRVSATAPHAILVEYGTVKMPAQPFMRPALRANHNSILANIGNDLGREIEATARRAAKRAARKAGK